MDARRPDGFQRYGYNKRLLDVFQREHGFGLRKNLFGYDVFAGTLGFACHDEFLKVPLGGLLNPQKYGVDLGSSEFYRILKVMICRIVALRAENRAK